MTQVATVEALTAEQAFSDIMQAFFGPSISAEPTGPFIQDGRIGVSWRDEATLRKGLAEIARSYGWTVQEEVIIPGWGRVDLVLGDPGKGDTYLVELKLELTKPAKVRRAFQQADGYHRWWAARRSAPSQTLLVATKAEDALLADAGAIYPAVQYLRLSQFIGVLAFWGNRETRTSVARRRRDDLLSQVALLDLAIQNMSTQGPVTGSES